jgi:hypothetical protein
MTASLTSPASTSERRVPGSGGFQDARTELPLVTAEWEHAHNLIRTLSAQPYTSHEMGPPLLMRFSSES